MLWTLRSPDRLPLGLPPDLWLVEVGVFLNMLGYGAVLPFEIIYLHDVRGFSLGFAGVVAGAVSGLAVVGAPIAGPLIDRFGAQRVAAVGGVALAFGYGALAFVRVPWQGLLAAAAAGLGNGALQPSQSSLIASLTTRDLRHRATAVSRVAANVGIGVGGAVGGWAAAFGLRGFVVLYLANALTYLVYVVILWTVVDEDPRPAATEGYGRVLGDGAFVRIALVNVVVIAVGWGVLPWVLPPYAREHLGVGPGLIGTLMLANALTVVVAQIPVARLIEGRRRALAMGAASTTFGGACLLMLAADQMSAGYAYAALLVASVAVAVGECFHSSALIPLVADLAPAELRGRYMAAIGLSWWVGLAVAPTAGGRLLSVSPAAALVPAAAAAVLAGVALVALERRVPVSLRLTPRPAPPVPQGDPVVAGPT